MIPTIPLLNAQQQGIAALVNNLATRTEATTQAAQHIVANLVKEESQKLEETASSSLMQTVSEDGHNQGELMQQEQNPQREPEENVERSPSSHNPLAGKLFDTRV